MTEQKVLQIEFVGLSKIPRKMHILAMGHRDFFETFHSVMQAIGSGVKIGRGRVSFNPLQILQGIDFDTFERIATKTLGLGILEGVGTIENPLENPHFIAHPDELYVAVYSALVAQNPDMFGAKKNDSKLPETAPNPTNTTI